MNAVLSFDSLHSPVFRLQETPAPAAPRADTPARTEQQQGERPRMAENEIDYDLVRRVQAGDKRAFDLLVRKYQHKLVSVISR